MRSLVRIVIGNCIPTLILFLVGCTVTTSKGIVVHEVSDSVPQHPKEWRRLNFERAFAMRREHNSYIFCATRSPRTGRGGFYEPYPTYEDRSPLVLAGQIDTESKRLKVSIAGKGRFDGCLFITDEASEDLILNEVTPGRIVLKGELRAPPAEVEETRSSSTKLPNRLLIEVDLLLIVDKERFAAERNQAIDWFHDWNDERFSRILEFISTSMARPNGSDNFPAAK